MAKKKSTSAQTQIGLHSVKNILGDQLQLSLFSDHTSTFCDNYGLKLQGTIDRFGVDISDVEARVMEGILAGFSETYYEGNMDPKNTQEIALEKYSGKLPPSYKNINSIPRLRITQSKLLELSGINKNSIAAWSRGVEAAHQLGTKQFCFYYDRLVYDDHGNPLKDDSGRWKKEEVVAVDTLFTIKEIREEGSGVLKYYEIEPSPIFLDQRESYFMLVPFGWREEVKALVGNKKASSYTFRFLLFLRYQYELFRRSARQKERPYKINLTPEDIAITIKMPESVYLRKKKRAFEILEDAYSVAKRLGYLLDYDTQGPTHILTLNDGKFFRVPEKEPMKTLEDLKPTEKDHRAEILFDLFHKKKKSIDSYHSIPEGETKNKEINAFIQLLGQRPADDIKEIINWALVKPYWCTQAETTAKLSSNFSKIWIEYSNSKKVSLEDITSKNKALAQEKLGKYELQKFEYDSEIVVCNQYIEIGSGNNRSYINYSDKEFIEKLKESLKKWKIPVQID